MDRTRDHVMFTMADFCTLRLQADLLSDNQVLVWDAV